MHFIIYDGNKLKKKKLNTTAFTTQLWNSTTKLGENDSFSNKMMSNITKTKNWKDNTHVDPEKGKVIW